jgi:hypothetical protein
MRRNIPDIILSLPILISFTCLCLFSCSGKKNKIEPASVPVTIIRFDKELFNLDIYNLSQGAQKLSKKYPAFFSLYTNKIIEIGDISQDWFPNALSAFVTDQAIYRIYKRAQAVFPDLDSLRPSIESNFGRFKTLFPEKQVPKIYTYISGFNQSLVIAENILGISLEKYLGTKEPLYNKVYPPIPLYQRQNMRPERIPVDMLRAWIESEFEYRPEHDNLLSRMIYEGRNMYLLNELQPEIPDTLLWGFSSGKLRFCEKSEKQMWTYLIENKLLFSSDHFRISQLIEDAPFTKDFSQESPGRAVVWIGYRVIERYLKKNSGTDIKKLMEETNFQKILNDARYNPA